MAISNDHFIISSMIKLARIETSSKAKNELLDRAFQKIMQLDETEKLRNNDDCIDYYEYSCGSLDVLFEGVITKATNNFTEQFKGRAKEMFKKAYPDKEFEHGIYKIFGTWMRKNRQDIMRKTGVFFVTMRNGNAGVIYWIVPNDKV